jgi:quinohemoprotein ethanol dehydrogenase
MEIFHVIDLLIYAARFLEAKPCPEVFDEAAAVDHRPLGKPAGFDAWSVTRRSFLIAALLRVSMIIAIAASPSVSLAERGTVQTASWPMVGGNYQEQHFSWLTQINSDTVSSLGLAWAYDIPTHLGQEATPVVVDGIMYVATDGSNVKALNVRNGTLLWSYDARAYSAMVNSCCGVNNRGVAVWEGRVYVGTLDGRLVALDASTGRLLWSVMTVDADHAYTISGVPRIIDRKVIIGNAGAEFGVRGFVTAYDALTGKRVWRFYTVPGVPGTHDNAASDDALARVAAATWTGQYWLQGGGGAVWDAMAYDPVLHLLYFGTANGSPWNPINRSPSGGDNLFLSSIVAVNPDTGKYVWHYQETPGDEWDFDATPSIILADLKIRGRLRRVILQASKNGFFYVIDRKTGELLSAAKFAPVNWASGIDLKTGRPIVDPAAHYDKIDKPVLVLPGTTGAHSWQSMAFSPISGLSYFPVQDLPMVFVSDPSDAVGKNKVNLNVAYDGATPLTAAQLSDAKSAYHGWLAAWDPAAQREVWRVQLPHFWNGGALATAGNLVFQGNGGGEFAAYDARNGKRLWSFDAQTGIIASAMSYSVDGEQYIAIMAGWGGGLPLSGGGITAVTGRENGPNRLLVFKLGGTTQLAPLPPTRTPGVPIDAPLPPPPTSAGRGAQIYSRYCFRCHGIGAVSGGLTPDLRYSDIISQKSAFADVVLNGVLVNAGMTSFAKQIDPQGAEDIRAYLITRARDTEKLSTNVSPSATAH